MHYSSDLPLILECDSSNKGLGAVLSHRFKDGSERPTFFKSRSLSPTETNYGVIEKEALAIVYAVRQLFQYLIGRKFIFYSDHKPLMIYCLVKEMAFHKLLPVEYKDGLIS